MYYFLKKSSRPMALLLAVCMILTMFAGCGKTKQEENPDPSEDNQIPPGLVEIKPTEAETEPPETEPEYNNVAYVSFDLEDPLPVKSSPSSSAKDLGFLDPGTQVEIIKTSDYLGVNWALIREGWVMLDYLDTNGPDTPDETKPEDKPQETTPNNTTSIKGTVTSNGLNIRKEPNVTSDIVGNYKTGAAVTILETKNGWGRTDKGWISMTYVKTEGTTANNNNNTNTNTTTTKDGAVYFVTATQLNIRDEASTNGKQLGSYALGDKIVILETKNGWGKTDKGWVSMQYAYKTGATGTNTARGIVTSTGLNVRSGPGTGYDSVGTVNYGKRVDILEQITIGNTTWGCIGEGWISLGYVYVDGTKGSGAGTGTVEGDAVNIRSGPGTTYESVGSLKSGDTIEILAQFEINGTYWGCINKGWVCMDYVGVG